MFCNRLLSFAIAICIAIASASGAIAQNVQVTHPTFLESVVFFVTGKEPPAITILSDAAIRVPRTDPREVAQDFQLVEKDPCYVMVKEIEPPYGLKRWNFNLMPGPRSAVMNFGSALFTLDSDDFGDKWAAFCNAKRVFAADGKMDVVRGSTMCTSRMQVSGPDVFRRLAALSYIRANFCPGLPEPPLIIKPF